MLFCARGIIYLLYHSHVACSFSQPSQVSVCVYTHRIYFIICVHKCELLVKLLGHIRICVLQKFTPAWRPFLQLRSGIITQTHEKCKCALALLAGVRCVLIAARNFCPRFANLIAAFFFQCVSLAREMKLLASLIGATDYAQII